MYEDMLVELVGIFISHFLKGTAALLAFRPTFPPSNLSTFPLSYLLSLPRQVALVSFPCGHTPRYLATTLLDAQAYPSEGINARAGYRSPELNTLSTFEGCITIFFYQHWAPLFSSQIMSIC
jgi:hypothetical protein